MHTWGAVRVEGSKLRIFVQTQSTPPVGKSEVRSEVMEPSEEMEWRWDADKLAKNNGGFCCYLSCPELMG